jgi:hypothetical protein
LQFAPHPRAYRAFHASAVKTLNTRRLTPWEKTKTDLRRYHKTVWISLWVTDRSARATRRGRVHSNTHWRGSQCAVFAL